MSYFSNIRAHINIPVILLIFCICLGAFLYVKSMETRLLASTRLALSEQETALMSLAAMVAKDGADDVVENIIKDCDIENREKFDAQLSKLQQLRGAQLQEIEQLFNACGDYFAVRKAVMVMLFNREFERYSVAVDQATALGVKSDGQRMDSWKTLVSLEKKRSDLTSELVKIQGEIIKALRSGASVASDDMQATLVSGQKIREELVQLTKQVDEMHQAMLSL